MLKRALAEAEMGPHPMHGGAGQEPGGEERGAGVSRLATASPT